MVKAVSFVGLVGGTPELANAGTGGMPILFKTMSGAKEVVE